MSDEHDGTCAMSQHNPYNANMNPGGYNVNGAANANPAAAAANQYGAAYHAAAAAGTIANDLFLHSRSFPFA